MKSTNSQETAYRLRQNGNISSINLATGEQVLNRSSLPNSPPKEKIISQQQQLMRSQQKSKVEQIKQKNENLRDDTVIHLQNDENDFSSKDIKKVNLNIMPLTSKVSNNINVTSKSLTNSNNSSQINLSQQSKQKKEVQRIELNENLKKSLPTVNESAPRMKSDKDYCLKQESLKDIQIRQQDVFPVPDCSLNNYSEQEECQNLQQDQNKLSNSKNIEGDKQQIQPLSLSVKYPIQQGFINLFELKKSEEQYLLQPQKPLSKSLVGAQKSQNSIQSLEKIKQTSNSFENDQTVKQIHLFQSRSPNQAEQKSSAEFFQSKSALNKNTIVQVNSLFNQKNQVQVQQKVTPQSMQLSDANLSFQEEQSHHTQNNGGGFYGESSPLSLQPVEIPIFDLKTSAVVEGKQSQKDLLSRKNFAQQKKLQTPINIPVNQKNKNENTKRESKKTHQGNLQGSKEQRILVICESSSQTREWINRFLGMRNIQDFETFTLPGGPGCLCVDENEDRVCWQNSLKRFTQTISKIYQLQEIQVYQNSNSIFNQIFNQDGVSGRGSLLQNMQDNLKLACSFIKDQLQLPVKGYFINSKGIVEKII